MLRISLIGHLGSDAELRSTQKGSSLVEFRVAVSQLRAGTGGEREESTDWFRVRVMGRQIEPAQRLAKGARVFVAGRLDVSHYQSRDGAPRTGFDVWADEVQNLSPRPSEDTNRSAPHSQPAPGQQRSAGISSRPPAAAARSAPPADEVEVEDLPW